MRKPAQNAAAAVQGMFPDQGNVPPDTSSRGPSI
jgi:hypothetical protein